MMHSPRSIPVIIDGPNFVNRVLELGIAASHVARQIRIRGLMEIVDRHLEDLPGVTGTCSSAEFVCSPKRFGPVKTKFSEGEQNQLLQRIQSEVGVYVDCIAIPGISEKGVDTTIAGKLQDLEGEVQAAVLVSADRDYIPTLKRLRHKLKVILVSISEPAPIELQNEAYATISLGEDYRSLFSYSYPSFNIDELDEEKLAILISETDDRQVNQLRVYHDGEVRMVPKPNTDFLDLVKFRFESFGMYNGYTGPVRGSDEEYVKQELGEIRKGWELDARGYIDYSIESVYGKAIDESSRG